MAAPLAPGSASATDDAIGDGDVPLLEEQRARGDLCERNVPAGGARERNGTVTSDERLVDREPCDGRIARSDDAELARRVGQDTGDAASERELTTLEEHRRAVLRPRGSAAGAA